MVSWTKDDVLRWLDGLCMSKYRAAFQAAGVDGRRLVQMSDDDLYGLGVTEKGHLMVLQRAIKIETH